MLKPEPMTKVVICGLNQDLPEVSHILSQKRLVHLEDYGVLEKLLLDLLASSVLIRMYHGRPEVMQRLP